MEDEAHKNFSSSHGHMLDEKKEPNFSIVIADAADAEQHNDDDEKCNFVYKSDENVACLPFYVLDTHVNLAFFCIFCNRKKEES